MFSFDNELRDSPLMIESNTPESIIADSAPVGTDDAAQLHDLLPFTVGDQTFAVLTDQVDATAEARPHARLPRAPAGVVGVVCVRGRMLTVLDAATIVGGSEQAWSTLLPYVLVLHGDEQLGLAAETCRDTITISDEDIERSPDAIGPDNAAILGTVTYAGEKMVILDASRLFRRAVQRRERRRRRF